MQTSVTFKNLDPSDHLKAFISDKLNRLDKYFYNPGEANVVLCVEKFRHIAEINIVADRLSINGKEETEDMYSAIDMVLDKLEKQIKKGKQKTRNRRSGKNRVGALVGEDTGSLESEAEQRVIMETIEYKPMDVDEAILQMELLDDHFMVFTNSRSDRVNVLYRRKDGNYGLIQPTT